MVKYRLRIQAMAELDGVIRKCEQCRLYRTRTCAVPGEGPVDAKMMICGQAPGRTEDREGRPFVGRAGRFLDKLLNSIGLERRNLFLTSPIKCFPPSNRLPKSDELDACRPYLTRQINLIHPDTILALGRFAVQTLLSGKYLTISRVHGKPKKMDGIMIFPTFHPAAAMRFPKIRALMEEDFTVLKDSLSIV